MTAKINITLLAVIAIVFPFLEVLAQSEAIKSAREEAITTIEKIGEALPQNTEKEILLKKEALEKVLNLSIVETADLLKKISELRNLEPEVVVLRDRLIITLDLFYQNIILTKDLLSQSNTLETVQSLAGSFRKWRESEYDPVVREVIEFLLAIKNNEVLKIADQRYAKISEDIEKFSGETAALELHRALLNHAALMLGDARQTNNQAVSAIIKHSTEKYASENQEDKRKKIMNVNIAPETNKEKVVNIRDLIEHSLKNIQIAYQDFIELNKFLSPSN